MTAPACRIVAAAIAARGRPVEDTFDPAAHTRGGFRLCGPDRLKDLTDMAGFNRRHGQRADQWIDVGGECRRPLRAVLVVLPPGFMAVEERRRTIAECPLPRQISPPREPRRLSGGQRIHAFEQLPATQPCFLARLSQTQRVRGAKSHLACPAL